MRSVRETEKAAAQLAALAISDQLDAWIRIAGILFSPEPDPAHERDLPFPWVATVFNDGAFEIWYRRRADGDVTVLSVRKV